MPACPNSVNPGSLRRSRVIVKGLNGALVNAHSFILARYISISKYLDRLIIGLLFSSLFSVVCQQMAL
jgi:hypothetical protein